MSMNAGASAGAGANGLPVRGHAGLIHTWPQPQPQPQLQPQPQPQPQLFHDPLPTHPPVASASASVPQPYPNQPHTPAQFDFSSVVSSQIMQDLLRLSTPVGSSPNDDTILSQALYDSRQSGKTYRQALEGLHGVNNHAANLWKDYYLDHHDRFDVLVSRLSEQPRTVKKPFVPGTLPAESKEEGSSHQVARKRQLSPSPLALAPSRQTPKNTGRPLQASRRKRATPQPVTTVTSALNRPPKRPRSTFNSLSAPLPSSDVPNLMPPQVHIPLPDPPSRSPTPPAFVQAGASGNRYTKDDREYFIKFLLWRLKQNPLLTKKEICELLHQKVPHHTFNSWASHWHQRHDIADKIFATYHTSSGADARYEDQQNEEEEGEVEAEIKDDDDDDDDAQSESMSANEQRGRLRSEGTFSDSGNHDVDTEEDEADMGEPGTFFTRGDWNILARFIARNHWDEMTPKERWETFTETYATKRPGKSWGEFYRKNEAAILMLSKKYSPEFSRSKSRRRRSWRNRRETSQELCLDEDGEYDTDDGGN